MANSNSTMIHKLQSAINSKGYKLLYNKTQFYSDKENRPVTQYTIRQVIDKDDLSTNKKHQYVELFKTCSQIQIVLFLRDFWYDINGWEVPKDNQMWEEAKAKYEERKAKETT